MQLPQFLILNNQPPQGTDWVGYETFLEFIQKNSLMSVAGDFVEIGTFLGGGAYKLSRFLAKQASNKRLYVIDIFDPNFDATQNCNGRPMKSFYAHALGNYKSKSQFEVFSEVTKKCTNITVLPVDSKKAVIPSERLSFCFIDGNHDPEYVRNDFGLVWSKLSPGGAVAFHDYGGDLPQTTAAIKKLVEKHSSAIKKTFEVKRKTLLFIVKK